MSYSLYLSDRALWRKNQRIKEEQTEILINPISKRISLFPIKYDGIWKYYKKHLASHWVAEEIDYTKDTDDWNNKLNDDERKYIKMGLAFFANSDFIVNESGEKDTEEIYPLEYKFFVVDKMNRENIHSETYALLLNEYVKNDDERTALQHAVTTIDTIKQKADWFRNYVTNGTFVERVLAEAIMEGLFFSGTFASIFWLKKRGLMPSLSDSNEFISRDEALHSEFNCFLYNNHVENKLEEQIVIHMVKEAVEIEKKFVKESLPVELIGMNSNLMCQYIEYVADFLLNNLIGKTYYKVENPFDWISLISLKNSTDFFSNRVNNYGNSFVLATSTEDNKTRFDDFSF